jgi:hypothetical protein
MIASIFVVCWIPVCTVNFIIVSGGHVFATADTVAILFMYCNSALDPIVYALMSEDFRRGFIGIIYTTQQEQAREIQPDTQAGILSSTTSTV